ncbi:MAG: hypothetical protein ACI4I6_04310 [Hominimerdicola sp.]
MNENKNIPENDDLSRLCEEYEKSLQCLSMIGVKSAPKEENTVAENSQIEEEQPVCENTHIEEESSPEHEKIVEKIKERNSILSRSIWTNEPVLMPQKSVWLDDNKEPEPAIIPENDKDIIAREKPAEPNVPTRQEVILDVSKLKEKQDKAKLNAQNNSAEINKKSEYKLRNAAIGMSAILAIFIVLIVIKNKMLV